MSGEGTHPDRRWPNKVRGHSSDIRLSADSEREAHRILSAVFGPHIDAIRDDGRGRLHRSPTVSPETTDRSAW
jgi:hypothetical protein